MRIFHTILTILLLISTIVYASEAHMNELVSLQIASELTDTTYKYKSLQKSFDQCININLQ